MTTIRDLTAELNELKRHLEFEKKQRAEHTKIVSSLNREINVLSAQVLQLQTATHSSDKESIEY